MDPLNEIEDAIEEGVAAFGVRLPDSANPFAGAHTRSAWLIGWRFAEAKAERDAMQREVFALQEAVAELRRAVDRLETAP